MKIALKAGEWIDARMLDGQMLGGDDKNAHAVAHLSGDDPYGDGVDRTHFGAVIVFGAGGHDGGGRIKTQSSADERMAEIVKRVNAFDDLVAALKAAQRALIEIVIDVEKRHGEAHDLTGPCVQIDNALSKAGALT